jgi:eukaryotic-like serine/threonine-protein kinase
MQPGYLLKNRYRIQKPLARGGFGQTYLAVDEDPDYPLRRRVVVKHLKPQTSNQKELDTAIRLFKSEAEALARLGETTDLIPTLYYFFEEGGEFYLIQEFIEGLTLTQELGNRKLSEAETLEILQAILVALKLVHDREMIHRDLKPDNIIRRAETNKLVLIDFGAVKKAVCQSINPQILQSIPIGTPGYTPPEQNTGHPRFASDIYAVGAIGLQCLTGIYPYNLLDEHTSEFNWRHQCQVSEHTANVLAKMVVKDYEYRYVSVTEAQKALTNLAFRRQHQPTTSVNNLLPTQVYKVPAKSVIAQPAQSDLNKFIKWIGFVAIGAVGIFIIANNTILLVIVAIGCFLFLASLGSSDQKLPLPPLSTIEFTSVKLNQTGDIIEEVTGYAQCYEENLGNGITLPMVKICAGTFLMGSNEDKRYSHDDEKPVHQVTVEGFYMGQTQITQSQYQSIMSENPSGFKGHDRPVESISWHQAQEFCQKLSAQTGRSYTLPSESQWEYACRAGTNTRFCFGNTISTNVANYNGDSTEGNASQGFFYRKSTSEVAQFSPNAFGLHDMHGNVWEWCKDHWHENYQSAPNGGEPWIESSSSKDAHRVVRGGSWDSFPRLSRSAVRYHFDPSERHNYVGFRLVISAKSLS